MNTVMPSGIHTKLSHMLQDPIVRDEDDGALHLFAERQTYLDYACAKLYRILSLVASKEILHNVYRDAFVIMRGIQVASVPGMDLTNMDVLSIRFMNGMEIGKVDFLKRDAFSKDFANSEWWYVNAGRVEFPRAILEATSPLKNLVIVVLLDKTKLIPIVEYEDVVLLLAAERAYATVGNASRSQQFAQQFASEMQLLGTKIQEETKSK